MKGTKGAEVIVELTPRPEDIVIRKRRFSGFYGTDLDLSLRERGIERLVIAGTLTDICVYHTAVDAVQRAYEVVIVRDGVSALSPEEHEFALRQMGRLLGARIVTSAPEEVAVVA